MNLERYDSYKDSEINWLGEIPSEWKVKRVKDLTSTQSGTTPQSGNPHYYDNGETFWIRTTDLNNREIINSEYKITQKAFEDYSLKILPFDSVLVAMYGGMGTIGKNGIVKTKATLNQSVCAVLPKHLKFDSQYFQYYLQYFRPKWEIFADSARKDPNINQDAVKNLFLCFPKISEQKIISEYLETNTSQIDQELSILEQKIEKYKELKQTLIAHTVLRGLDKNVELKSSEVEWIGDIPKHWEVKRLKDIAMLSAGNSMSNKENYEINNYAYPYIATKDININTNNIDYNNGIYVPKTDSKYKIASKYTTLLCIEGGSAGKKVAFLNQPVCYVNKLCNIKSKSAIFSKYTYYFVASHSFRQEFFSYINGLIGGVSIFTLKTFSISVPPYEEQVAIANYLDEKTSKIDSIVEIIGKKIEVLKEFRKTLINDVVTGKVKVA